MVRFRYVGESFWPQVCISSEHVMSVCNVLFVFLRITRYELYVVSFAGHDNILQVRLPRGSRSEASALTGSLARILFPFLNLN